MRALVLVGAGGCLGAIVRFLLASAALRLGLTFPVGTFAINVSGSLALGVLMGIAEQRALSDDVRLGAAVGFLGAYTTFSTFTWETVALVGRGEAMTAIGYVAASVALGLAAALAGLQIGRGW